jgi:hypothetical protein
MLQRPCCRVTADVTAASRVPHFEKMRFARPKVANLEPNLLDADHGSDEVSMRPGLRLVWQCLKESAELLGYCRLMLRVGYHHCSNNEMSDPVAGIFAGSPW